MNFIKRTPLHPFLFGVFPILTLFENNMRFISETELVLPIIFVLLIVGSSVFFLKYLLKNNFKSEIIVTFLIVLSLTYGTIYFLIDDVEINGVDIGRHRYLLILFFSAIILFSFFIIKSKKDMVTLNYVLNFVSIIMVSVIIFNVVSFEINDVAFSKLSEPSIIENSFNVAPDIYFIILDGYPGEKSLEQNLGYDNSNFLDKMESIGFVNHEISYANYPHTFLSIPSMLNMKYLNYLDEILSESRSQTIPYSMGSDNLVMNTAKSLGYTTFSFDSGWGFTRSVKSADLNMCGDNKFLNSEFLINVVKNSILNPIYVKIYESSLVDLKLCVFDELPKINEKTDLPIFVFAHIFMPHPPYLFNENGELNDNTTLELNLDVDSNLNKELFLKQMIFLNSKIFDISKNIIENEDVIIIIASDHGTSFTLGGKSEYFANATDEMISERMDILLLTYNPKNEPVFDDLHTPVNIFRKLYSHYFNLEYPTLPDRVYFGKDGYYDLMNKTNLFFN